MTTATQDPSTGPIEQAVDALAPVLGELGRDDLVARVTAAGARLKRPATVVCVVGEFKQGKSTLVNGLLGRDVCPVDDDLATSAITLVRYGEEPAAIVRRRVDGQPTADEVPVETLGDWVSEQGNPRNEKGVERVEIAVPSAMLKQGVVLVDTPGMGGLGAGHAAATLAFLPFADGLVLVSDASAELSAPEVEFLHKATELCPTVLFAQTKIDLYPAWERIFELNRGHLHRAGVDIPMVAASASLRSEALARKDRDLNERSGFPPLIQALSERVVTPAKENAAARSAADLRGIVAMVKAGLEDEQRLLSDPSKLQEELADLERAKEKLEHLRGPAARWTVVVGDRVADLSNDVMHRFRHAMRTISRRMEEEVETLTKGTAWDETTRELQSEVADEVTQAFFGIEEGRVEIRAEVAKLIADEEIALPGARGGGATVDVLEFWQGKSIDKQEGSKAGRWFRTGVGGIRGAQGGVYMFGMLGRFLPAGAATMMAANPVLLGAGAIFGGMQLMDDRKRKVAARRQAARTQVRQFIDDVQFQVGNEITNLIREIQRELRDDFTARLAELQRTYTETAQRAQEDAKRSQEEIQARLGQVQSALQSFQQIERLVAGAGT